MDTKSVKNNQAQRSVVKSKPLDLMTMPLTGRILIEASAGTGKTFSIAILYLRLLLNVGKNRFAKALNVKQILVVTFTKAATEELRHRIRANIHQLRTDIGKTLLSSNENAFKSNNPIYQAIIDELILEERLEQAEEQLRVAQQSIDEASIYTIDSFCLRLLERNAFNLKQYFTLNFKNNEDDLMLSVVRDFWRTFFSSLTDIELAKTIYSCRWRSPDDLLADIYQLVKNPLPSNINIDFSTPLSAQINAVLNDYQKLCLTDNERLKTIWTNIDDDFFDKLLQCEFKKSSKYRKDNLMQLISSITQELERDNISSHNQTLIENSMLFCRPTMKKGLKKDKQLADAGIFNELADFFNDFNVRHDFKSRILFLIVAWVAQKLEVKKNTLSQITHGDALVKINDALSNDSTNVLSKLISTEYPVALIDEFQDTNQLQYSVFNQIYQSHPNSCLLMIGDPKQAIYGFRGGDIFTYIDAKQSVDYYFDMSTNWRSSKKVVEGVNQFFNGKHNKQQNSDNNATDDGVFLYSAIPFINVKSAPQNDHKQIKMGKQTLDGVSIYMLDSVGKLTKGDYQSFSANHCANQIRTWLDKKAELQINETETKLLGTSDITILVRSSNEANIIQKALSESRLQSVYLSDNQSVFQSQEAAELLTILTAVSHPNLLTNLSSALATQLIGKSSEYIFNLSEQTNFDEEMTQFIQFKAEYEQSGIFVMLRKMMTHYDMPKQILTLHQGERILTNLMHLCELLQSASVVHISLPALIQWLNNQISSPDSEQDNHQQRLESDENLIKVMTMHKAKGLEFPVVCIPFGFFHNKHMGNIYHSENQLKYATQHEIDTNTEIKSQFEKEKLSEDIRLLYVALTRPIYYCLVGFANVKQSMEHSAIFSVLARYYDDEKFYENLTETDGVTASLKINKVELSGIQNQTPFKINANKKSSPVSASTFDRTLDLSWNITSYTGLMNSAHSVPRLDLFQHNEDELLIQKNNTALNDDIKEHNQLPLEYSIFSLERGALIGSKLHTLFENIEFNQADLTKPITNLMAQINLTDNLDKWQLGLASWLKSLLNTKLDDEQLCLAKIDYSHKLSELEFFLPIRKELNATAVNQLVQSYDVLSKNASKLNFSDIKGMLKGFIDLIFEYEGRYYIADYKSNYLGPTSSDYNQENIEKAMIEHRYDFQYQLYTLALHRYLKQRIKNYDYDQHFGGGYYLFIRGMSETSGKNGIFFTRPEVSFVTKLDQLFG